MAGRIEIVSATSSLERALKNGGADEMSRRERKLMERVAHQAVNIGMIPDLVVQVVDPVFQQVFHRLHQHAVGQLALLELLEEKGILTEDEMEAKVTEINTRLMEAAKKQAAQQEGEVQEEAPRGPEEGQQRLVEPEGEVPVRTEDEEKAPRRLVEGVRA